MMIVNSGANAVDTQLEVIENDLERIDINSSLIENDESFIRDTTVNFTEEQSNSATWSLLLKNDENDQIKINYEKFKTMLGQLDQSETSLFTQRVNLLREFFSIALSSESTFIEDKAICKFFNQTTRAFARMVCMTNDDEPTLLAITRQQKKFNNATFEALKEPFLVYMKEAGSFLVDSLEIKDISQLNQLETIIYQAISDSKLPKEIIDNFLVLFFSRKDSSRGFLSITQEDKILTTTRPLNSEASSLTIISGRSLRPGNTPSGTGANKPSLLQISYTVKGNGRGASKKRGSAKSSSSASNKQNESPVTKRLRSAEKESVSLDDNTVILNTEFEKKIFDEALKMDKEFTGFTKLLRRVIGNVKGTTENPINDEDIASKNVDDNDAHKNFDYDDANSYSSVHAENIIDNDLPILYFYITDDIYNTDKSITTLRESNLIGDLLYLLCKDSEYLQQKFIRYNYKLEMLDIYPAIIEKNTAILNLLKKIQSFAPKKQFIKVIDLFYSMGDSAPSINLALRTNDCSAFLHYLPEISGLDDLDDSNQIINSFEIFVDLVFELINAELKFNHSCNDTILPLKFVQVFY